MVMRVFGPLAVEGAKLSPRERTVLAVLALVPDRPVSTDELADALWGERPPGTWPKQLQASIARVRAAIGRESVETTPEGYALRIDPDSIDARRFERYARAAREHLADDPARSLDAADRALALWRGIPYADLASWPAAAVEAERLTEVRMDLEEVRLRAALRQGEHSSAVADAERLVREAPLREARWALLATALYRSGRQSDALAAIRAARTRLADELGVEPGEELTALEVAVLRHDASLEHTALPPAPAESCPYRGLAPFGEADEADFFGRDADVAVALSRLANADFLAVSGASGSGKSSLVRAGMVPALRRRGDRVLVLAPGRDLDLRLRVATEGARRADVVVVDQFEEVFHSADVDAGAAAAAIARTAAAGATVVLVVRSDFLDDCAALPELAPLVAEGVHLVGPMSPAAERAAIEEPARRAGLRLEPGLVELMLRDAVGEAGALPHLSHALAETWLRREGATLTVAGYEASGGISGAIAQSAEQAYAELAPEDRHVCRAMFLRLIAPSEDGAPVRRRVPLTTLQTDDAHARVLALLTAHRLVSTGEDVVDVAHEAVATAWPRLRTWLAEDAEGARTIAAIAAAATDWDAAGRSPDDLYRGARLEAAEEWRANAPRDLIRLEQEFLDASVRESTEESLRLAERARRDRRQNRRLTALLAAAGVLIVLLVTAGTAVVQTSQDARTQRDRASIEALVATALALRSTELEVAALLAAEAYRREPDDPRTRSGLTAVLQAAGGLLGNATVPTEGRIFGSTIPGRDGTALVVDEDGPDGLRDTVTGELLDEVDLGFEPGPVDLGPYPLVAVSGDGRIGAVLWPAKTQDRGVTRYGTSPQSDLVAFDLGTGERVLEPLRLQAGTGALALSQDGATIAVADARDGSTWLVSTAGGAPRRVAGEHPVDLDHDSSVASAVFDADGDLLVGRLDDRIDVIDPVAARVADVIRVPESTANLAMALGPSGVVVASGDAGVVAVDPAAASVRWTNGDDAVTAPPCTSVAIAEPWGRALCGTRFGRITALDLADGAPLADAGLGPVNGEVGVLSTSADGLVVTAISTDDPVLSRWRLDGDGPGRRLVAAGRMLVGGYSFEGSGVLTAPIATRAPEDRNNPWADAPWAGVAVTDTATGGTGAPFDVPLANAVWAHGRRVLFRDPAAGVVRIVSAETGEDVAEPHWGLVGAFTSAEDELIHAVRFDGRIQDLDPVDGSKVGEPWAVRGGEGPQGGTGMPLSLAAARGSDLIAVTVLGDGQDGDLLERFATVRRDDHSLVDLRFVDFREHAMAADGEVIALEGDQMIRYALDPFERTGSIPGSASALAAPSVTRDADTMAVTALDGTVLMFDTATGIRIGDPFRSDLGVFAPAVLRSDGLELAVSTADGVVVWDLDPERQLEAVCRLAGRGFTATEQRTYNADGDAVSSACGFDG
ncbi:BTAD domain-containing putative transcriptional regulator [Agromyces seonyuensis]|nr:BTAD domain-containing putative transcriptional regulator [Agromyces seonyuensis]